MPGYDLRTVQHGYMHANVTLSGEASRVAEALESLKDKGVIDDVLVEIIAPIRKFESGKESRWLPKLTTSDTATTKHDIRYFENRMEPEQLTALDRIIDRFAALLPRRR